MAESQRVVRRVLAGLVAVPLCLALAASPASADVQAVSGSAFGEQVNMTSVLGSANITSGPLPSVTLPAEGGGPFTNSVTGVDLGDAALRSRLLEVSTQGTTGPGGSATSSASVLNAVVGPQLAPYLTASSIASSCTSNESGSTGQTTLLNAASPALVGTIADFQPGPNTTFQLPLGITLIFNEQIRDDSPGYSAITVNAVHVIFNGPVAMGDIIIAQSHCDVTTGPGAVIPEAPLTVLLPLTTLALFGAAAVALRRRRPASSI